MEIRTEKLSLTVEGAAQPMPAYVATPAGAGPFPAVIVIEEIFGVNSHIRDVTERVAREGYVAIAPDIHHRDAPGQELKYDQEGMQKGMALIPKLTAEGFAADMKSTLGYLRGRKDVRGDRIGCMGFCIGGHLAYLAACTTDVKATASFYGGGIASFSPGGGPPTVAQTPGIAQRGGRILCLFGGQDSMIPADQVDTIRKALADAHVKHEVIVYPSSGHGFFCDQRGSYNPADAADAWERVKSLFKSELAS
jgi:carboxymethylenebutenolidase